MYGFRYVHRIKLRLKYPILLDLQIQFDGPECHVPNLSYYVAFATVFFLLALVCLIQLVMCIVSEWQRMKAPSLLQACHVTTQKLLYFVVFLASVIRGAYFTSPVRKKYFVKTLKMQLVLAWRISIAQDESSLVTPAP
jgi:hypothetical protein